MAAVRGEAAAGSAGLVAIWRGEWGRSLALHQPVSGRAGAGSRGRDGAATLGAALGIAWLAVALLCMAGLMLRREGFDLALEIAGGGLLCLPAAVVAVLAMYLRWGPAVALAMVLFPRVLRYARGIVAEGWRQPHVLAAKARGVAPVWLALRHVCLPAAPQLLTLAGISVSLAAGAVVPVEALCDSAGLGQLGRAISRWRARFARASAAHVTGGDADLRSEPLRRRRPRNPVPLGGLRTGFPL